MKRSYFPYFILVFVISILANWAVQMIYYYYMILQNPQAFNGVRTLFDYQTGFIGDTIIVPLMNTMILFSFLAAKFKLKTRVLFSGVLVGFFGDVLLHFMQGELKLTNWSMPKPFEWNFVSYWHMISFFFQLTYITLFFILLFEHKSRNVKKGPLIFAITTVLSLMILFIALFLQDYRGLLTI